jgi:hypothetical protein
MGALSGRRRAITRLMMKMMQVALWKRNGNTSPIKRKLHFSM